MPISSIRSVFTENKAELPIETEWIGKSVERHACFKFSNPGGPAHQRLRAHKAGTLGTAANIAMVKRNYGTDRRKFIGVIGKLRMNISTRFTKLERKVHSCIVRTKP